MDLKIHATNLHLMEKLKDKYFALKDFTSKPDFFHLVLPHLIVL
jgi:hypothetical protein